LVDLLPAIEEANMISIKLDKKVKFTALPVKAEARGDFDQKIKVCFKYFKIKRIYRLILHITISNIGLRVDEELFARFGVDLEQG
jgi:hypothetical protein